MRTRTQPDRLPLVPLHIAAGPVQVFLPFQTLTTRKRKSFVFDFNNVIIHVQVFLPFQTLTTRKRKDVAVKDIKVQVVLMAFDCLYLNGEVMLRKPLIDRRAALYASIKPEEGKVQFAVAKTSRDVEELQACPSPFSQRELIAAIFIVRSTIYCQIYKPAYQLLSADVRRCKYRCTCRRRGRFKLFRHVYIQAQRPCMVVPSVPSLMCLLPWLLP